MDKKNRKSLWIIILVIALLLVFGIFAFIGGGYSKCVDINLAMCLTSKKYLGKEGIFSFRYSTDYPLSSADWASIEASNIASSKEDPPGPIEYEDINFSNEYYRNAGGDRLGYLLIEKNSLSNVEDYKNREINYYNGLSKKWKEEFQIKKPEFDNLIIGGESAVTLSITQGPHSFTTPETKYIFFHDGRMYTLSFTYNSYYHKLSMEHYDQARRLILSTFKFYK